MTKGIIILPQMTFDQANTGIVHFYFYLVAEVGPELGTPGFWTNAFLLIPLCECFAGDSSNFRLDVLPLEVEIHNSYCSLGPMLFSPMSLSTSGLLSYTSSENQKHGLESDPRVPPGP